MASGLIVMVLGFGLMTQWGKSKEVAKGTVRSEEKEALYDWINQNAGEEAVVMSLGWETVVNIPAQTQAYNFSPIGLRTVAPTKELIERYLWAAAMYGAPEGFVEYAFTDPGAGLTTQWSEILEEKVGAGIARTLYFTYADEERVFGAPPEVVEKAVIRYGEIKRKLAAGEKPPFRLDYVLVGPWEKKLIGAGFRGDDCRLVFSNSDYQLYEIRECYSGS